MSTSKKIPVAVIDCTPTWQGILPGLLAVLESGSPESVKVAKQELKRMAQAADRYNEQIAASFTNILFEDDLKKAVLTPLTDYGYLLEQAQDREGDFWKLSIYNPAEEGEELGEPVKEYQYQLQEDAKEDMQHAYSFFKVTFDGI